MIPRHIHYCWFGGKPMPLQARLCLASWTYTLPNYRLTRWDESNFDPSSHPFTAAAYAAGRYAFVSDYVRMKVLKQHGGIYLDVDVEVHQAFDTLLDCDLFIGLEDRQRFATSIIGAQPEHWLATQMLAFYDRTGFDVTSLSALVNVNEVSALLLAHGFDGGGNDDERIGATQVLRIGRVADARGMARQVPPLATHLYAGTWKSRSDKNILSQWARKLRKLPQTTSHFWALQAYRFRIWKRARSSRP